MPQGKPRAKAPRTNTAASAGNAALAPKVTVLRRKLGARDIGADGVTRLLDSVTDGAGRVRAFFGNGTAAAAFAPDTVPGMAMPEDLREISGATLAVLRADGPCRIALATGGAVDLVPAAAEWGLFAGLNCIFGFRLEETAAQVAEGLIWLAHHHGLEGALIVYRVPGDQPHAFSGALETVLIQAGVTLTVVLLDCPLPLGKPDSGPESHPYLAPAAPGQDRMTPPSPAPWRSRRGEGGI